LETRLHGFYWRTISPAWWPLARRQQTPALLPPPDANPFEGRWIFTGAGCRGAGSVAAVINDGKVIVRGGGGNA
jgi:hypothetical protein